MAAPTITLDQPKPIRLGNSPFGIMSGLVNVSTYDTAHPEVTAITGKFKVKPRVTFSGVSSTLYMPRWDATGGAIYMYQESGASGVALEAIAGTNCGVFSFTAVGQLG